RLRRERGRIECCEPDSRCELAQAALEPRPEDDARDRAPLAERPERHLGPALDLDAVRVPSHQRPGVLAVLAGELTGLDHDLAWWPVRREPNVACRYRDEAMVRNRDLHAVQHRVANAGVRQAQRRGDVVREPGAGVAGGPHAEPAAPGLELLVTGDAC